MTQEEIQDKIKTLKTVLKTLTKVRNELGENQFTDLSRSVDNEIDWYKDKLEAATNILTYSDMIGKYYKYCKEYVHIISVNGNDVMCDKFNILKFGKSKEFHVYRDEEFSYFEIHRFKEITKEEFFKAYHEMCNNFLKNKEND